MLVRLHHAWIKQNGIIRLTNRLNIDHSSFQAHFSRLESAEMIATLQTLRAGVEGLRRAPNSSCHHQFLCLSAPRADLFPFGAYLHKKFQFGLVCVAHRPRYPCGNKRRMRGKTWSLAKHQSLVLYEVEELAASSAGGRAHLPLQSRRKTVKRGSADKSEAPFGPKRHFGSH